MIQTLEAVVDGLLEALAKTAAELLKKNARRDRGNGSRIKMSLPAKEREITPKY